MAGQVYVVVQAGKRPGAVGKILRWAHALLPAVIFLAAPGPLPAGAEEEDAVIISVDADDVAAGPLALADAIARRRSTAVAHRDPPTPIQ